jgi:outer membrane receptor protein involved in Fe transport
MSPALSFVAALAAAAPQAAAVPPAAIGSASRPPAAATQGITSYPPSFFADGNVSTAIDMVQRLPGFTLDTGASVRGYEGAAGNVLVDGARPASKTDPLDQILYRIPASQVDHIEVIRGGAPGIDMQGKSVLANVVRKKAATFRGVFVVADNYSIDDGLQRPGYRLEGSGPVGPGTLEAGVRYGSYFDNGVGDGPELYIDPTGKVLRRSQVHGTGSGHQPEATGAYETSLLGGNLRVSGKLFWDHYVYQENNFYSLPAGLMEDDRQTQDVAQTELGGRYARALGSRAEFELIGLRQTKDFKFGDSFASGASRDVFGLRKEIVETIGRGVLKYRATPGLSFEVGGETAVNTLASHTTLNSGGAAVALPAANVEVEEDRSEVFAKAVWRPGPAWTVEGGLRYEMSSISSSGDVTLEKDLHFAKPRLLVAWAPIEGTQVRARIEREVGQLNFDDFVATSSLNTGVVTTGNPDLNPQSAWVGELAIEQAFWRDGSAGLSVRHYEISDATDRAPVFTPGKVFDGPANIGDGTRDELQLDLTLPLGRLGVKGGRLQATSTWRRSEVTDPTTHAKRDISATRPVKWEAHFTQPIPSLKSIWGVDVDSGWEETKYRFDQISTEKLKTWVRPFIEYKPQPDLVFRVEIQNATERGDRLIRKDFGGPRSTNALRATDDRDIQVGRSIYLRIRKTLG